jgi:hypothetical protein
MKKTGLYPSVDIGRLNINGSGIVLNAVLTHVNISTVYAIAVGV